MSDDVRVTSSVVIPAAEIGWRFCRSSGPGGQGVNTTDSRVELTWSPASSVALSEPLRDRALARLAHRLVEGELTIVASEYRSQLRNRDAARARLAALVRDAVAPPAPARRATRPSKSAKRRRTDEKKRRGEIKRLRRSTGD